jgi:hypothetical protein
MANGYISGNQLPPPNLGLRSPWNIPGTNTFRSDFGGTSSSGGRGRGPLPPGWWSMGAGLLGEKDPPYDWPAGPSGEGAEIAVQVGDQLIGRGRRAADRFVQFYQNPFGAELADIVKRRDAGDIEGAKAQFGQAWNRYRQGVAQGFAQGGNDAVVAQQSLNTPSLRQTADSIARSLGLGNLSWGRNQGTSPAPPAGGGGGGGLINGTVGGNEMFPATNTSGTKTEPSIWDSPNIDFKDMVAKSLEELLRGVGGTPVQEAIRKSIDEVLKRTGGTTTSAGTAKTEQPDKPWWQDILGTVKDITGWLGTQPRDVVNLGADIFGRTMQSRALGDYNERLRERTALMDRLGGEERARRDYFAQTLMPNLLRGTGHTPEQLAKRMQQFPVSQPERRT